MSVMKHARVAGLALVVALTAAPALAQTSPGQDTGAQPGGTQGDTGAQPDQGTDDNLADLRNMPVTAAEVPLVVWMLNVHEALFSDVALMRSRNPAVLIYAEKMVAEHALGAKKMIFFKRYVLDDAMDPGTPGGNRRGDMAQGDAVGGYHGLLARQARRNGMMLFHASDAEFDLRYIEGQVRAHQRYIQVVQEHLLPVTTDAKLRQELEMSLYKVQVHLMEAQQLLESVKGGFDPTTGGQDPGGMGPGGRD